VGGGAEKADKGAWAAGLVARWVVHCSDTKWSTDNGNWLGILD